MSFFDPLDIRPSEESEVVDGQEWFEPEWFGPPAGVIGGVIPYRGVLYQDDRLAMWIDRVLAFPDGLMIFLELHIPGRDLEGKEVPGFFPWALVERDDAPWSHPEAPTDPNDYFRFGVRYEDGRSAATTTWDDDRGDFERLSNDPPGEDDVVLLTRGGSGGAGHASVGLWVWPSPAGGPVEVLAKWPAAEVPELRATISAEAIEVGQRDIHALWPKEPERS